MNQTDENKLTNTPSRWDRSTRTLTALFLVVFGVVAISLIKPVFTTVVLGFLFSFILFYPIRGLAKRMPRHYILAQSIIFLVVALVFAGVFVFLIKNVVGDAEKLAETLKSLDPKIVQNLLSISTENLVKYSGFLESILKSVFGALTGLVDEIATLFTGLFVGYLLMMNMHSGQGKMVAWVPQAFASEVKNLLSAMDQMWVRYMLVQVIYASCIALGSLVLFILAGVPYPLPLAILVGILSVIPVVGGILGSIIIAAVCLVAGSTRFTSLSNWEFALIVLVLQLLISQGIYLFIGLPITGRMVKLPIVVVLVGAMIGLSTGSILIAFLSVPLISTAKVFGSYALAKALNLETPPTDQFAQDSDPGFFSQLMIPKYEKSNENSK